MPQTIHVLALTGFRNRRLRVEVSAFQVNSRIGFGSQQFVALHNLLSNMNLGPSIHKSLS